MIGQSLQFQSRCFSIFKVVQSELQGIFQKMKDLQKFLCCHKKNQIPVQFKNFSNPFFSSKLAYDVNFLNFSIRTFFFDGIQRNSKSKKKHFNLIMVIFKKLIFTTYQNSAIPAIWSYVSSAAFLFEFYLSSSNTNHQSLIFNYVLLLCLVVSEINDKSKVAKNRDDFSFLDRSTLN